MPARRIHSNYINNRKQPINIQNCDSQHIFRHRRYACELQYPHHTHVNRRRPRPCQGQRGGIYISTGRPKLLINNLGQIEDLIDGYITTNGALCIKGETTVYCNPVPQSDIDAILADSIASDYACLVAGERDVVLVNAKQVFTDVFINQLNVTNIDTSLPLSALNGQRILQFSPFIDANREARLMQLMPNCVSGRWHPAFCDITSSMADKGKGLEKMAEYLGLDIAETMAFGDGGNDISILRRAGVGVAMGNAGDDVKQAADYVTSHVDDNGIRNALMHYGVID